MSIKWCENYHQKNAVKKCEECGHEWCPTCERKGSTNFEYENKCPACGTTGYKIHLAKE